MWTKPRVWRLCDKKWTQHVKESDITHPKSTAYLWVDRDRKNVYVFIHFQVAKSWTSFCFHIICSALCYPASAFENFKGIEFFYSLFLMTVLALMVACQMLGMRLVLAHIIQSSSCQLRYQLNAFAIHFTMYWKIPIEVGICWHCCIV